MLKQKTGGINPLLKSSSPSHSGQGAGKVFRMAYVALPELAAPNNIPTSQSSLYLNILLAHSTATTLVSLLFPVDASHLSVSSLAVPSAKLFSKVSMWLTTSPSPNLVQIFAFLITSLKMNPYPFLLFPSSPSTDLHLTWYTVDFVYCLFPLFLSPPHSTGI